MEGIAAEVSQKLKSAIKAKLMELGAYVDEELPNYVMVMVTNRRSKIEMDRELNLFLGGNTSTFTSWLQTVWTKLEQVRVANIGIEKKKSVDKKKKPKKAKSSSESEDDRKHKKKRKSSVTSESSSKENKKRKTKGEISETENELVGKEETGNKKPKIFKSAVDIGFENDLEENFAAKKSIKGSSILDEDDFLNIKEDFESEFLSDEEVEQKTKIKVIPEIIKSLSKVVDKLEEPVEKKHHVIEKHKNDEKTNDKSKDKENKNVDNTNNNETVVRLKPRKTVLIRNRQVIRSRSRSRSRSPITNLVHSVDSESLSRSKSRSNSPPSYNVIKLREKSPVLDARELINRKRALQHSVYDRLSKDDKIPLKRQLLIKKSEESNHFRDSTEKENDLREKLPDNKSGKFEDQYKGYVVNKMDGKRSVASPKNDKIDLRKIKRTVFVKNDNSETEEHHEKSKINKSIMNQIVKYIKEEPVVLNSAAMAASKPTKLNRSKLTPVQSASSTLIRKAMADAHKSLTVKDEANKKREVQDVKSRGKKEDPKNSSKEVINSVEIDDDTNEVEIISTDTIIEDDKEPEETESSKVEVESKESRLNEIPPNVEEYDPSQNMPQFIVTLTGLDPKLYPGEESEMNGNLAADANQNFEEKVKPKVSEQCKYYPNCLAGDQCLYHHPTIPCKMFPNCKFGNNCLYLHPKCKFDAACTRYDCPFIHTTARMPAPVSARHVSAPTAISAQPCKFYYNCVNPLCPFQHPKICRYDRVCTNKNCTFQHTSLSHVNAFSKDKLKWSRPKTDEEVKLTENIANET